MNVLVVWDRPQDFQDLLEERFPDITFHFTCDPDEAKQLGELIAPKVMFTVNSERFPRSTHRIAAESPGVEWVHVGGSGYDHLGTMDFSRVVLTNSAGVFAVALAETVTGAMLALNGHFPEYMRQQQTKTWKAIPFTPLSEKTLLVVGMGKIGQRVAANAKSLGMRVLGANRSLSPKPHLDRLVSLEELRTVLPEADFVTLHLRLTPDTRHLIGQAAISAMKPGACLINTSRGPVVDTAALIDALDNGRLGAAYLDVFEQEPLSPDSRIWDFPNVMITPHSADQVYQWPRRFAAFFADNLERWLKGERLMNEV